MLSFYISSLTLVEYSLSIILSIIILFLIVCDKKLANKFKLMPIELNRVSVFKLYVGLEILLHQASA